MLLNCGVGEDSWESLGLQGDSTSLSQRKSVLTIQWKDWSWSWNSNTLATWCEELTHQKKSDVGKDWTREEKGMTEDEMVGRHHWLDEHEFEQAQGGGDGQGSLACCSPWGHKELDMTEWLNWTELIQKIFIGPVAMPGTKDNFEWDIVTAFTAPSVQVGKTTIIKQITTINCGVCYSGVSVGALQASKPRTHLGQGRPQMSFNPWLERCTGVNLILRVAGVGRVAYSREEYCK